MRFRIELVLAWLAILRFGVGTLVSLLSWLTDDYAS